jgi:hypothetical protein
MAAARKGVFHGVFLEAISGEPKSWLAVKSGSSSEKGRPRQLKAETATT